MPRRNNRRGRRANNVIRRGYNIFTGAYDCIVKSGASASVSLKQLFELSQDTVPYDVVPLSVSVRAAMDEGRAGFMEVQLLSGNGYEAYASGTILISNTSQNHKFSWPRGTTPFNRGTTNTPMKITCLCEEKSNPGVSLYVSVRCRMLVSMPHRDEACPRVPVHCPPEAPFEVIEKFENLNLTT